MNRRGFLSLFASVPIALALAEPLIARVERTIFLPPAGGWTGNRETNIFYRGENLTEAGLDFLLNETTRIGADTRALWVKDGIYVPYGLPISHGAAALMQQQEARAFTEAVRQMRDNSLMASSPSAAWRIHA